MQNITIFTTPTCGFCVMTKNYLTSKNINFTEKDVTTDIGALKYIQNRTGQNGVPVIQIDDNIIVGFDRVKIDELVKKA